MMKSPVQRTSTDLGFLIRFNCEPMVCLIYPVKVLGLGTGLGILQSKSSRVEVPRGNGPLGCGGREGACMPSSKL